MTTVAIRTSNSFAPEPCGRSRRLHVHWNRRRGLRTLACRDFHRAGSNPHPRL